MCTIITTNKINESLIKQIKEDSLSNREGMSLVTFDGSHYEIIKTYSTDTIEQILKNKERIWFHSRMATTRAKGITFTHAFLSGKYIIMHNGIIRCGMSYDVDTMIIGDWLKHHKPTDIQPMLSSLNENYANVFLIDTELHKYFVIRQSQNTLFNDGQGNYSTNSFDEINKPTDIFSCKEFYHKKPEIKKSNGVIDWPSWTTSDWDDSDSQYTDWLKLEDYEISELKRYVRGLNGERFWSAIEQLGYATSKGQQRQQVISALTSRQALAYKRRNPKISLVNPA